MTHAEENKIESFHVSIQEEIDYIPKQDMLTIMGHGNAKGGSKEEPNVVGEFVLGVRNKAGK